MRDPAGEFEDTPLLCTDLSATATQIIEWFVPRWNIEVTFQELRAHLGVETQRQWSDRAIGRTAPCLFGLFSLVTLMTIQLIGEDPLPVAQTAWYRKEQATFSDVISLAWRKLWAVRYSVDSLAQSQSTEFNLDRVNQLLDYLSEAA